jgi:hypothetical protein
MGICVMFEKSLYIEMEDKYRHDCAFLAGLDSAKWPLLPRVGTLYLSITPQRMTQILSTCIRTLNSHQLSAAFPAEGPKKLL